MRVFHLESKTTPFAGNWSIRIPYIELIVYLRMSSIDLTSIWSDEVSFNLNHWNLSDVLHGRRFVGLRSFL